MPSPPQSRGTIAQHTVEPGTSCQSPAANWPCWRSGVTQPQDGPAKQEGADGPEGQHAEASRQSHCPLLSTLDTSGQASQVRVTPEIGNRDRRRRSTGPLYPNCLNLSLRLSGLKS